MADKDQIYQWCVVGAGVAGIAAVGKLLDSGIHASRILWIDNKFKVGDVGAKWRNVSSNTRVELFINFFEECDSFQFKKRSKTFFIENLKPEETCKLKHVADPLQLISDCLSKEITAVKCEVFLLKAKNLCREIYTSEGSFKSLNVILAIGSEPNRLQYNNLTEINLKDALNYEKVKSACEGYKSVAVFGSSHSAIIILRHLVELNLPRIVNFYLEPLKFALPMENWTLFDNTGLKGTTADWARKNINGNLPGNLFRYPATEENINNYLYSCEKVVYAIGFSARKIEVPELVELKHNVNNGIIAPGLFGFGIAFPEHVVDPFGYREVNVGMWKFMTYINRVLPVWLRYGL